MHYDGKQNRVKDMANTMGHTVRSIAANDLSLITRMPFKDDESESFLRRSIPSVPNSRAVRIVGRTSSGSCGHKSAVHRITVVLTW